VGIPAEPSPSQERPTRHLQAVPDLPSLDEVYRDHVDFVARITRQLGVPAAHVEDVVHDVFVVVHRRLPDYEPRAPLRSWLYGITKRVVMHHQRHARRLSAREQQVAAPVPEPGPDEDLAQRRAARVAEACLARLDASQRVVLVLADVEGMTAPEIADTLGVKLNTVYSRLRLARRRFERLLAQHRGGDT
jgi:RNA polymerase sigma-70 factor (ECF subfamily)